MNTVEEFINQTLKQMGYLITVDDVAYRYGFNEIVIGTEERCELFTNYYEVKDFPIKGWYSFKKTSAEYVQRLKTFNKPIYLYINSIGREFFITKNASGLITDGSGLSGDWWIQLKPKTISQTKLQIIL
jgi:hypothetical protein